MDKPTLIVRLKFTEGPSARSLQRILAMSPPTKPSAAAAADSPNPPHAQDGRTGLDESALTRRASSSTEVRSRTEPRNTAKPRNVSSGDSAFASSRGGASSSASGYETARMNPFSDMTHQGSQLLDLQKEVDDLRNKLQMRDNSIQRRDEEIVKCKDAILQNNAGMFRKLVDTRKKDDEIQQKNAEIQQKDAEIQQKDVEIQQKDVEIQQKDIEIQQKDVEIQRKDVQMQQKNVERQEKDVEIQQNNVEIQRKDVEIRRKGVEMQQKDAEIRHKNAEIWRNGAKMHLSRVAIYQKVTKLQEQDTELQKKDATLRSKDAYIRHEQDQMRRKDESIACLVGHACRTTLFEDLPLFVQGLAAEYRPKTEDLAMGIASKMEMLLTSPTNTTWTEAFELVPSIMRLQEANSNTPWNLVWELLIYLTDLLQSATSPNQLVDGSADRDRFEALGEALTKAFVWASTPETSDLTHVDWQQWARDFRGLVHKDLTQWSRESVTVRKNHLYGGCLLAAREWYRDTAVEDGEITDVTAFDNAFFDKCEYIGPCDANAACQRWAEKETGCGSMCPNATHSWETTRNKEKKELEEAAKERERVRKEELEQIAKERERERKRELLKRKGEEIDSYRNKVAKRAANVQKEVEALEAEKKALEEQEEEMRVIEEELHKASD
ncbi:hypothetical protein BU16DRAFT_556236 [Lophium mytilinum]|uniref:Uncharacterized protein n=1 Tax=Lophium mytilinum TaxID=390894 RepID=A0A6A6RBN7_9PEZI|nr:hypothetical protein BU16DRAFT_556236 [Lophium mytilinum]